MPDTTSTKNETEPEGRKFTPLEMFTELEGEVRGLGTRFDAFATETNGKFTALNASNARIESGQRQMVEAVIELKNKNAGMDVKDMLAYMGAGFKTLFGSFAFGSILITAIIWITTSIAFKGDAKVEKESLVRDHALELKIIALEKDKEVMLEKISHLNTRQQLSEQDHHEHTSNGHPFTVIKDADRERVEQDQLQEYVRTMEAEIAEINAQLRAMKQTKP